MRSVTISRAGGEARRASDSRAAHVLARAGLAARGIIYILIGWVAVLVALGHGSHEADQQGALQLLAGKSYGTVSLWLLGIGFAGYALWRLSEAAFGAAGEGHRAGPRLRSLGRTIVYGGLAYLTFKVLSGTQGSQAQKQQDVTASVMQHSGGRWLVGLAGLVVVVIGVVLVTEGIRRTFMKYLLTSQMSRRTLRVVSALGVIGTIARGVVVVLVGILVTDAAVTHSPAKSGGIDQALLTLRDQPFGPVLLGLVALGLVIFGVYGLCEARWRKV
jgi:membrane protease YdiL (CAAX protease family)